MNKPSPFPALIGYFLPIIGSVIVFFTFRRNFFALRHATQILALYLLGIIVPILWFPLAWLIAWVPYFGPSTSAMLFALVLTTWVFIIIAWIVGIINCLRGKEISFPLVSAWGVSMEDALWK